MKKYLRKILFFALRHVGWMRILTGGLLLLSLGLILRGTFTYDALKILPANSESARTFACLSDSGMFNRIVLVFTLKKGTFADSALPAFLDRAAAEFKASPMIRSVTYRTLSAPLAQGMSELTSFQTRLVSPDVFPRTERELDRLVEKLHSRLMLSGVGQTDMIREDPFSLNLPCLRKLEGFRSLSGLEFQFQSPYLVSTDGKHALMILRTSVPIANPRESRALVAFIDRTLSGAPRDVQCSLIASHLHSIANEEVLKADVQRLGVVSLVIFLLLFILFYKSNFRTLLIPLIPFLASIPALAVMTLIFKEVLLFTVGMGGVIVGLGVDYGIYIFSAMTGDQPYRSLTRLLPSLFMAMLTSVLAFCMFMISRVEAFVQFGFFAAATLFFTFFLMLILLPGVFAQNRKKVVFRFSPPSFQKKHPGWTLLIGTVLILTLGASALRLRFNSDIRQFDVADRQFAEREALFNRVFQKGPRSGFLLITGKTRAEALENADREVRFLRSKLNCDFFSPADMLGTEAFREKNLDSWRRWERAGGLDRLQENLCRAGEKKGIDREFFDPFFNRVREGLKNPSMEIPSFFSSITEEMIHTGKNGVTVAVMIPDGNRDLTEKIHSLTHAVLLSGTRTPEQMSADVTAGIFGIGFCVCFFVFLTVLIFFRNLRKTLVALSPVLASLAVMGGIHSFFWRELNLSVMVAGIVVVGLSVNYGIIMTGVSDRTRESIFNAVTFSAVTSIAGGITVLFANHLMLRSAGLTLVTGIAAAWAAGVFLIPVLDSPGHGKKLLLPVLLAAVMILAGCRTEPFAYPAFEPVPADFKPASRPEFKGVAEVSVVLEKWFYKITFLVLLRLDGAKGNVELYAASPGGGKVFEASGTPEKLETFSWMPFLDEEYRKTATEMIYYGLCRAYRNDILPRSGAIRMEKGRFIESFRLDNTAEMEYIYAGKVPSLIRKRFLEDGSCRWEVFYYRYELYGGTLFPRDIVFEDHRLGYRLILRTRAVFRDGEKP